MLSRERKSLPMAEWSRRVRDQQCRTISGMYKPLEGGEVCEYVCTAADFLSADTYLVRFTNPDGSSLVPYNDPDATPILIRDFVSKPAFVQPILQNWDGLGRGNVVSADLLVQRCSSCDRRIVIDGVHRVVWVGVRGNPSAEFRVSELSGSRWPSDMPDMNMVCNCLRQERR